MKSLGRFNDRGLRFRQEFAVCGLGGNSLDGLAGRFLGRSGKSGVQALDAIGPLERGFLIV